MNFISFLANFNQQDHSKITAVKTKFNQELNPLLLLPLFKQIGQDITFYGPIDFSVGANISLADNIIVDLDVDFKDYASISIGKNTFIGPNVTFNTLIEDPKSNIACAPIKIENDVKIGGHVTIQAGVTIHEHAVIGAGSVVTSDVPAFSFFAGNPAKKISSSTRHSS